MNFNGNERGDNEWQHDAERSEEIALPATAGGPFFRNRDQAVWPEDAREMARRSRAGRPPQRPTHPVH